MNFFKRIIIFILIILFLVLGFFIYNGYKMYKDAITYVSLEKRISDLKNDSSYVCSNEVPEYYKNAIVAVEDHRFYEHGAIDIIAIGRAIVSNVQAGELNEGASTITQQVAKNLYFIKERNYAYRKVAELFLAFDLEKNYSKDDILEFYFNTIYFGEGYYGIKEASKGYYKKDPKDLNLYEATLLAGVPNAPSVYAPTINPHLAKSRQGKVIRSMVEYGYLTAEEAKNITSE